jgi:curved DNA-binding protein CbpA
MLLRVLNVNRKLKKKVKLTDYYGLLGLQELNVMATDEQIRKAYRAMSMLCHPDKATPEEREKAEARFKGMLVHQ